MKEQKKHPNIMGKAGKNPGQDWLVIITIFTLLTIAVLVFLVLYSVKTQKFIKTGLESPETGSGVNVKTKEEELRDIIDVYIKKKTAHETLLGTSKLEVEKPVATTTATTTSTVATSSQKVSTSTSN